MTIDFIRAEDRTNAYSDQAVTKTNSCASTFRHQHCLGGIIAGADASER
jgi:hypothetical protein